MMQCYSPSFDHLLRLIIILLPRKVVKLSFQRFKLKITSEKKNQMIKIYAFKEKETRKDPQISGQWKAPRLLALGMFQGWWPLVCSKSSGLWKESNV